MKFLVDAVPAAAFLAALLWRDLYFATAVLIVALWLSVAAWALAWGRPRPSHLGVTVAATVLGGLTLYLQDARFIKWKPTLVYAAFAAGMAVNLALARAPLMQKMLGEAFELPPEAWRRVDLAWIGFWLACAGLNLAVAYNVSEQAWGVYKIVSAFLLPVAFVLLHMPFLGRFLKKDESRS